MDYIVSRKDSLGEFRVYSSDNIEGSIVYKGHKHSLPDILLPIILDIKHDRSSNKNFFRDYKKGTWFIETSSNKKDLLESFGTLLSCLNYKKICY
jgi:hypothetical protein